ncbi:MAG: hypothetical protein IPH35_26670 [Rhodoferax sp.]|nr:hypothetical protein [Rhodoferax sp.]
MGCLITSLPVPAYAQKRENTRADELILDMAQAYKQRDRKRLATLLPQARGHVLEPWAAYWDLSARLDEASRSEVQEFFTRFGNTCRKTGCASVAAAPQEQP